MYENHPMAYHLSLADEQLLRKLAGRYRIVNIAWIVISILLFGTLVGSIAAIWNLYAVYTRWKIASLIEARDPRVPSLFGDSGWYITMALVNVVLGGAVGAAVVAYEYFFVRREVMKHRHLFSGM